MLLAMMKILGLEEKWESKQDRGNSNKTGVCEFEFYKFGLRYGGNLWSETLEWFLFENLQNPIERSLPHKDYFGEH